MVIFLSSISQGLCQDVVLKVTTSLCMCVYTVFVYVQVCVYSACLCVYTVRVCVYKQCVYACTSFQNMSFDYLAYRILPLPCNQCHRSSEVSPLRSEDEGFPYPAEISFYALNNLHCTRVMGIHTSYPCDKADIQKLKASIALLRAIILPSALVMRDC